MKLFSLLLLVSSGAALLVNYQPRVSSCAALQPRVLTRETARPMMVESWYDSGKRLDGSTVTGAAPAAVESRFDPEKDVGTNAVQMPGGLPAPVIFVVLAGILLAARGGDLGIGGM